MLTVDVYLQGLAALVTGLFAAVLLAGAPKRPPNQFLAFFLVLVAANQATEAYRGWLRPGNPFPVYDEMGAMAAVFAALDPFLLYAFASVFPRRNRLNSGWGLALVGAGSGLLVLARVLIHGAYMETAAPGSPAYPSLFGAQVVYPWGLALYAFTAAVYAVVFLHVSRELAANPSDPALRLLFPAASIATLPALVRPVYSASGYVTHFAAVQGLEIAPYMAALLAGLAGLAVAAVALVLPHWGRIPSEARRAVRWSSLAGLSFAVVFALRPFLVSAGVLGTDGFTAPPITESAVQLLVALAIAARWVLFGLLVSMAVVRHRMLDMSLAARRRAARALVAAAFVGAGVLVVAAERALLGSSLSFLTAGDLLVLGVALAASQWFRAGVDRVAARVYGVPLRGDMGARLEAYRAAVEQALEEGRSVGADEALARLRHELGLDDRAALVVERMAVAPVGGGPLAPGRVVAGRYQVARLLGRGGSGRVFLARDELLERDVVLKEVPHEGEDGEGMALREARAAGSLQHPNLVTVHDVARTPAASLIVTEHVPHGSLADLVEREGPLDASRGLRVLDGVLAALEAVHSRGIVHRDVKPANVLIGEGGTPKLTDFGLARIRRGVTVRFDEKNAVADGGTPSFMAPEQWRGEVATPATDLYAVGHLARRCIRTPLPPAAERVIERALQEDPAARWPTARAMREALRRAVSVAPGP